MTKIKKDINSKEERKEDLKCDKKIEKAPKQMIKINLESLSVEKVQPANSNLWNAGLVFVIHTLPKQNQEEIRNQNCKY